jgi:hypothetical protein
MSELVSRPVPPELLRVSDAERQRAAMLLGDHFATGRLTQQEYDERVTAAYNARTRSDVAALFADLPGPVPATRHGPVGPPWHGRQGRHGRPGPLRPLIALLLVASFIISATAHVPVFPIVLLVLIVYRVRRRRWARRATHDQYPARWA